MTVHKFLLNVPHHENDTEWWHLGILTNVWLLASSFATECFVPVVSIHSYLVSKPGSMPNLEKVVSSSMVVAVQKELEHTTCQATAEPSGSTQKRSPYDKMITTTQKTRANRRRRSCPIRDWQSAFLQCNGKGIFPVVVFLGANKLFSSMWSPNLLVDMKSADAALHVVHLQRIQQNCTSIYNTTLMGALL